MLSSCQIIYVDYNVYFKSFIVYLQVFSEPCYKLQTFCFRRKELHDRGSWTVGHVYFTQFMRSFLVICMNKIFLSTVLSFC